MKRALYLLLLLLAYRAGYSQTVLEVKFHNLKTGRAFLENSVTLKKDTIKIKEGTLSFRNSVENPTLFQLTVEGYNTRPMNFILSKDKTEVQFNPFVKSIENENIKKIYPNKPAFIKDPNHNQLFYEFHSNWIKFFESINQLSAESDTDELLDKRKATYLAFLKESGSTIRRSNDKLVSAVIINFLLRDGLLPLETIQEFYDYLSPSVKNSFYGIKIGEYAGKEGKLAPGNMAPAFELTDLNNQNYNLASLRGKKVLLHFWSSTCAPCIKEAPELLKLAAETKGKVITINVSTDVDKDKWLKGIERAAFSSMNNVCDFYGYNGKLIQDYNVRLVPTCYLIDEEGKIIIKGTLAQLAEELKGSLP